VRQPSVGLQEACAAQGLPNASESKTRWVIRWRDFFAADDARNEKGPDALASVAGPESELTVPHSDTIPVSEQPQLKIEVKLRHSTKPDSKIAAHADVVLSLAQGKIQLNSFCIFKPNDDGKPAWVAPPATKGEKKFFPLVVLSGEIRKQVEQAILAEFDRQTGAAF